MKALEFNTLRMITLMTKEYEFCEAFEKEGFSPDVSQLQMAYEAGGGKINHKAELALKRIYKEHIVEGYEEEIIKYNDVVMPIEIKFEEELKIVQLSQETIPDDIQWQLEKWASFKDSDSSLNETLTSLGTIEEMIPNCKETAKEYLTALVRAMNMADASYVQIVKV